MGNSLALFEETTTPVPARCCATCRWYQPRLDAKTPSGMCKWTPEKLPEPWHPECRFPPSFVLETYGTQCETWSPE